MGCACFILVQMMPICSTSHAVRAERGWKRFILSQNESILENGAQCLEIWEADYHLKPGKFFFFFLSWQSHPAKERATLGRKESLHHQDIKYFLGVSMAEMLLKGFRDWVQSWHGCCLRSLGMSSCDPVIWLQSSNTQSASKGLIIYSYTVRCFQERFPCSILISTL